MHPSLPIYSPRIQNLYPDIDLANAVVHDEGQVNVAVIAVDLVFRFVREERFQRTLARELLVLDRISEFVSLPIPRPLHREADLIVYRKVPGVRLLNSYLRSSPQHVCERIAADLGRFYRELHSAPIQGLEKTTAPVGFEAQIEIRREVREFVYPHLMKHQIEGAEALFASMLDDPSSLDFTPALIHGDVMPYHLLVDEDAGQMSGVIDFGVAGVGDPSSDIAGLLLAYGESFVRLMVPTYPGLESLLPRGRYRAQVLELAWTMQGLKYNNPFWFTAHLGGARDLQAT